MSADSESAKRQLAACEPPADLVQPDLTANAISVLERRYLKKDPATGAVVETPQQLFWRVATCVARPESEHDGALHQIDRFQF